MAKKKAYNRLAEVMAEKGFTQMSLSEEAGITQRSISLYVSGKREPNLETLFKIASALKCDPCDLLNR